MYSGFAVVIAASICFLIGSVTGYMIRKVKVDYENEAKKILKQ